MCDIAPGFFQCGLAAPVSLKIYPFFSSSNAPESLLHPCGALQALPDSFQIGPLPQAIGHNFRHNFFDEDLRLAELNVKICHLAFWVISKGVPSRGYEKR
jgi:hypothetical protein